MNFSNTPYSKKMGNGAGKLNRGVSIIGVGITPFGYTLKDPELMGYSEKELAAWAAQLAMNDANITSKEIDMLCFSEVTGALDYGQMIPQVSVLDWIGMNGKPASLQQGACAASCCSFREGVAMIASGMHDIVIVLGADTDKSMADVNYPSHYRFPHSDRLMSSNLGGKNYDAGLMVVANDYTKFLNYPNAMGQMDEQAYVYMRKHGLTEDEMRESINLLCIDMHRNGYANPRTLIQREDIDEQAKKLGFNNAVEAFNDDKVNPQMSNLHRRLALPKHADGAGAIILCASDIAKKYNKKSIEVVATAQSALEQRFPSYLTRLKEDSIRQVYEATGITGGDIDVFYSTDFWVGENFINMEMAGYVPEGEAWKMAKTGELAFDGSKPFNPHGGTIAHGHAYGCTIHECVVDAVKQMRGEAGGNQIKKQPKTALISCYGGGNENTAVILKVQE